MSVYSKTKVYRFHVIGERELIDELRELVGLFPGAIRKERREPESPNFWMIQFDLSSKEALLKVTRILDKYGATVASS
jgi:hypothetical protein